MYLEGLEALQDMENAKKFINNAYQGDDKEVSKNAFNVWKKYCFDLLG
jgi:hypothetical protein